MKKRFISGIIVVWLSMGVFCGVLANEKVVAAVPNATPEYTDAVNSFILAKRSDNPQRNYSSCIEKFRKIVKTTDNPALRIRGDYFLAFALFLQRDFTDSKLHAKEVLNLGQILCKTNPFAILAESISDKLDNDEVDFTETLSFLTAQNAGEASLLAAELLRYSQTLDTYAGAAGKVKAETLYSTVITLSLYAMVFNLPIDLSIEKAHQAECVSHLHELIAGWRKYRQDHDGKPVPLTERIANTGKNHKDLAIWTNLMQAYIDDPLLKNVNPLSANIRLSQGTVLSCPGRTGEGSRVVSMRPHYGMNNRAFGKNDKKVHPEQTVIFIDSNSWYVVGPSWGMQRIEFRHSDGANCAFADGRVEWLSRAEIMESAKTWKEPDSWCPAAIIK